MIHQIAQLPPVVGGGSQGGKSGSGQKKAGLHPLFSSQKKRFSGGQAGFQKTLQHFGTAIAHFSLEDATSAVLAQSHSAPARAQHAGRISRSVQPGSLP
jgi:hypothetical protein